MTRGRNEGVLQNIDWLTVLIYLIMVFMGWFNIYAAVYNEEHQSIMDASQSYGKQLIWIITAFFIALVILIIDGEFFPTFAYALYVIFMLLLLSVFIFGTEIKGSKSWIAIGEFRIQPAEFAKFAANLAIAKFLSNMNFKIDHFRTRIIAIAFFAIPAIIIILQKETGSALVFSAFILVLYREGLPGIYLFLGFAFAVICVLALIMNPVVLSWIVAAGCVAGIAVYRFRLKAIITALVTFIVAFATIQSIDYIFEKVLEEHQKKRINVLLGKEQDLKGAGYNVHQSLIAIGSGGLSGKGFLNGTQTKYNFVPEQSTDFIFCTVGEEWGFIGSLVVLALFLFLLLRLIFLAERQRSAFSRIYGYGLACIIFFHVAVNIGMTIGLAPVVGIPLPFFSYGGSSLWSFTILLFIFIRLDAYRFQILR
ncbi:MAG: rod shape-determining protein RodA [Flavobacteriales bacterium]